MPLKQIPCIDPASRAKRSRYTNEGRECVSTKLASPVAKQYAGYTLINADLDDAAHWNRVATRLFKRIHASADPMHRDSVEEFHQSPSTKPWRALRAHWVAAIATYGKCYAQADGRRVKLEASNLPEALRSAHKEYVELRNEVIAHGGSSPFERGHVDLVIDAQARTPIFWLKPDYFRLDYLDDSSEKNNLAVLISASQTFVIEKLQTLRQRLFETEVLSHDLAYWLKRANQEDA